MTHSDKEGVLTALMLNFEQQHLDKLLEIMEKVEGGAVLDEWEFDFLNALIKEAVQAKPMVDENKEMQSVYARAVHLYQEIISKALENERSA